MSVESFRSPCALTAGLIRGAVPALLAEGLGKFFGPVSGIPGPVSTTPADRMDCIRRRRSPRQTAVGSDGHCTSTTASTPACGETWRGRPCVLPLLAEHDFTLTKIRQRSGTRGRSGIRRSPPAMLPLTTAQDKLAIDVEYRRVAIRTLYPTKQQTGAELLELVHIAANAPFHGSTLL